MIIICCPKILLLLTLKALSKIYSRRHSIYFYFQRKQVLTFHVNHLQMIHMKCLDLEKTSLDISCESSADDSHEMSRLVFSEKLKKK